MGSQATDKLLLSYWQDFYTPSTPGWAFMNDIIVAKKKKKTCTNQTDSGDFEQCCIIDQNDD